MVRISLFLPLFVAASAVQAQGNTPSSNAIAGAFIVELEDGQDASDFYSEADAHAVTRMVFNSTLFRGASIQFKDLNTADAKADKMAQLPSVKSMWPINTPEMPAPRVLWTGQPDHDYADPGIKKRQSDDNAYSTHAQTQVDKLHRAGITGKGIKVAIIDSGIDYLHPDLGGCFGPNCLVSYGHDFVGNDFNDETDPVPSDDPMDCRGHGTVVAGIIAAQKTPYGFIGSAPGVTLGAYKIFGCTGGTTDDLFIAALLRAYEDGSNIISASVSGASGWTNHPVAIVTSRIVQAGIPCILSAGNDGRMGMFYAGSGASAKGGTTVASFENVIIPAMGIESRYSVGRTKAYRFVFSPCRPARWTRVKLPIWAPTTDYNSEAALGCEPYPAGTNLTGKIILLRNGGCNLSKKAKNAAAAGTNHVMFYKDRRGSTTCNFDASKVPGILAAGITDPSSVRNMFDALRGGSEVILDMKDVLGGKTGFTIYPNTLTGGSVSMKSSWGPTWDAQQKPQFGAVGEHIISTYPRALGYYAVTSGTSNACPQVAAIVALVAEARKTTDPAIIENLLSASAKPVNFNNGKGQDPRLLLAPIPQQGAGLIQAYDSAFATTLLSTSSLSFNDTKHFIRKQNFTIKNTSSRPITYQLSHRGAATAYTFGTSSTSLLNAASNLVPTQFPNELTAEFATLSFDKDKVVIPAGKETTIWVTPTPPTSNAARLPVWSGYVIIDGSDGSEFSLPYMGITGSLYDHINLEWTVLSTSTDFQDKKYEPVPSDYTFVLPRPGTLNSGTDAVIPVLVLTFVFGCPFVRADLVPLFKPHPSDTKTVFGTQTIGQLRTNIPLEHLSRQSVDIPWDGRMNDNTYAPAGRYKIVVRSLRIFGDASNAKDYIIHETSPFKIMYEAAK
ncbi:subtilase [Colletotrichum cereale]|nr:subtilase [Colletotrichum cereale]